MLIPIDKSHSHSSLIMEAHICNEWRCTQSNGCPNAENDSWIFGLKQDNLCHALKGSGNTAEENEIL